MKEPIHKKKSTKVTSVRALIIRECTHI